MPHLFRTHDGTEWKPGKPMPLTLADGTKVEGVWAGSAQVEKLQWWLGEPGSNLCQTDEVAAVAVRGEHTGVTRWGDAPPGAKLFFVLKPPQRGKNGQAYRLAKLVTTASTEAQTKYFDDERFSLFGTFTPDGTIARIPSPPPPSGPEDIRRPGELF
jgi:hypothetical protein